ncbi:MAG: hypothetical protein C0506_11355 [Anaerolinea sp.]|nr:hypothetical protein [Anaerolinea sp.]
MINFTDEMKEALGSAFTAGLAVTVATSSAAGMPDIALKGSTMAFDNDHLAFWERSHGQTLRNLEENPQVCLYYRNPQTRLSLKFFGVAELLRAGETRQQIMDRTVEFELSRDPERKGVAVLIRVDRILQAGQVVQQRD